jgi:hypothetical protein
VIAFIGIAIFVGYGAALWWLLRREGPWTFVALALLCGLSLTLRLVLTDAYPWGIAEDEPKVLACAGQALEQGSIFGESCIHIPYFLTSLFQAPLVPYVGANRWSMHSYSMLLSVLATPAFFGAARAMGLRTASSLVAGGLAAVLPWSIYYGRMILGGELIFHQALMIAGLAGLIWRRGGWQDALLAGFGLCLLLWDYWAGRSMAGMPLAAAVLATGWRRLWCVAALAIAFIGWYPHLATGPADANVGLSLEGGHAATIAGGFHPGFATAPYETGVERTKLAFRTLMEPVGQESIFTMRSVAMHPVVLLALAALGVLTGVRRGLFLLAGFVAGIVPGIVSGTYVISAHRIMMCYGFIALGAAAAVNVAPWRRVRVPLAAIVLVGTALWSIPFYFSDRFWPTRWPGDRESAALSDAIAEAPPAHLIAMHQIGFYGYLTGVESAEPLTMDNLVPPTNQAVTYAFTWQAQPLRPQYERLFPKRVLPTGRESFLVRFEAADWSWVGQHGWALEARCDGATRFFRAPFLFNTNQLPQDYRCQTSPTFVWRAHWSGPETTMDLAFSGSLIVTVGDHSVTKEGWEQGLTFSLPADTDVTISLTIPPGTAPTAVLLEHSTAGLRVPDWEKFTPLAEPAPPTA